MSETQYRECDEYGRFTASRDTVERIYAADRHEGRWLQQSVAMSLDQMQAGPEAEEWLKNRRLDELGAALIRELFKNYDGADVKIVVSQTGPHKYLVPECRHVFYVKITPLQVITDAKP